MQPQMLDPRSVSRIEQMLARFPESHPPPAGYRYATPEENLKLVRDLIALGKQENTPPDGRIYHRGMMDLAAAGMTSEAISQLFPCIVEEGCNVEAKHASDTRGVFCHADVYRKIAQGIDENTASSELLRTKREILERIDRLVTYHALQKDARSDVMREASTEHRRIKNERRVKARAAKDARRKARRS